MAKLQNALVIAEAVLAVLLTAGVLIQTPKASGLGATIGGGDSGLGGGYRTRRGLERQIYWTTWVVVVAFLACSIGNVWVTTHFKEWPRAPRFGGAPRSRRLPAGRNRSEAGARRNGHRGSRRPAQRAQPAVRVQRPHARRRQPDLPGPDHRRR